MKKKSIALLLCCVFILAAPAAAWAGVFGVFAAEEGSDERLPLLDEIAEPVAVSPDAGQTGVEVCQSFYEGNHIYVSYRVTKPGIMVHDGLELDGGAYADIVAGDEAPMEDGTVAGWKECVVPEEEIRDAQTFFLVFTGPEKGRASFTVNRRDYSRRLRGASAAETCRAEAELAAGLLDIRGSVRLYSPEQAAGWLAWQDGEDDGSGDTVVSWILYQDGEPVSGDLYGACFVDGTEEVVFELMFPLMDDLHGLSLVPEYSASGEKPEEAVPLEPAEGE